MNDDKNHLGRIIALALIVGAAYGANSIAHGGFMCPLGGNRCEMSIPSAAPAPTVDAQAGSAEKFDANNESGEDEDAKLEKKAPIAPPAKPQ